MKILVNFSLTILFFLAFEAQARVDCPIAKVINIQIEGSKIMYLQEGASWRTLGYITEAGTNERYSALLAAQMASKRVIVGYKDNNYDCSKTNYGTSAYIIRTYND
ncbi:hypothetical protein AN944_00281 [Shewanella sp. P1-14-1]|uniref:hypothetical protein n=1 Tax=Shewanella sp. P1-14-1 TaxID=1723761 RepID=UPI0006D672FD|nr:hypothetical protein [Shewanella sp. P1-14-1]KPZ73133.1 hypothetical protein AN944_00281 [Shewanella sp. P1-14-1]